MSENKQTKMTLADLKHLPWWTWLFIVACALLPIISLGGAIPMVTAVLGIILCIRASSSPTIKTSLKLLYCFGIVAIAWGLAYLFAFAVSSLVS